ncbi:MAG: hypothetical protein N2558_04590 [Patescibacteria group bacterium]|nr:hypothetical protein [Patescibacteria group bacterium]
MEILNENYISKLINRSNLTLRQLYDVSNLNFTEFDLVNSFLIEVTLNFNRRNILINSPTKEVIKDFFFPTILITCLHCLKKNYHNENELTVGDILVSKIDGSVSIVKEVNEASIRILPLGTTKRIDLKNLSDYILISSKYAERLEEIKYCRKRIDNFEANKLKEIAEYSFILSYFISEDTQLPLKNKNKVVIVASKNEIISKIPNFIPFQYVNKNGEIYPDTPFDPLLIVVNDFITVKNFFIEKDIPIDTIVFIGNTKYQQSISMISKAYRQQKFNHCIFIGTQDIESGENFEVLKWNWTLPEIKFFKKQQYLNITPEIIKDEALSREILNFTNFIYDTERRYENLINLKPLLKFLRKIYSITAIGNRNRIRERANEIYANFEKQAEEIFQDEFYKIDTYYQEDFELLKSILKNIIDLIKNANAKENWFKNATNIDYIVVPKSIKKHYEKEIQNCFETKQMGVRLNSFENIAEFLKQSEENISDNYTGLKYTKIITVSEFFKKEHDGKTHLFVSLYSNGIFTHILLKKILLSNHKTKILCYEDEAKAMQKYLHDFQKEDLEELRSVHRELLCEITYPETSNINTDNIDEWIKHLIELDEKKDNITYEHYYEIIFEDGEKIKERESRKVFVDGFDELYKEISQLKIGDNVRIYRNPDKETLHDIVKLTDEKDLFDKVDYFSRLWKDTLRNYSKNRELHDLFTELQKNGLSVSINTLELWLKEDCRIRFPQERRDLLAIIKTVQNSELNQNINNILELKKEYNGRLNKAGRIFSDEIDHYILTKEKGKMLEWLSDEHIEQIVSQGAPLKKIKTIKLIEEENEH